MRNYKFLSFRWAAIIISSLVIIGGIVAFVLFDGFNQGIDFTGGLTQKIQFDSSKNVNVNDVRAALGSLNAQVQQISEDKDNLFQVRIPLDEQADKDKLSASLFNTLNTAISNEGKVVSSEFVGPKFSSTLVRASILVVLVSLVLILIYIWVRFKFAYAVSAIIALVHDVFALLAFIVIFQFEFSSTTVAAILTIIGYSLNATIVIFDRIRENFSINQEVSLKDCINRSTSQSLTRTVITSLTTLLAIIPLAVFAQSDVQLFAINLIIGVVIGAFSSNFIAPTILYWLLQVRKRRLSKVANIEYKEEVSSTFIQDVEIPKIERKLRGGKRKK